MVKYIYDAWGNHAVVDRNDEDIDDMTNIGNMNPFRYNGYYYDVETGFYYLKTRYYDPELGRFISQDSIEYADPETINGLNLYAYCANNPVMADDPTGTKINWKKVFGWVATAVVSVFAIAVTAVGVALSGGSLALLGGVLVGAGTGFLFGAGASLISQGSANNWNWSKIDPFNILESGAIGSFIGAASGLGSGLMGEIGSFIGKQFGFALSNTIIGGLKVGKAFSYLGGTKMFMSFGSFFGKTLGALLGGALANEYANNIFGKNPNTEENIKNSFNGLLQDWSFSWILKFFKWLR